MKKSLIYCHEDYQEELIDLFMDQLNETYKDVTISPDLTSDQRQEVMLLPQEFEDIFSDCPGIRNLIEHKITPYTDDLVRRKPYAIPYDLHQVVDEEVESMHKLGVICNCDSICIPHCPCEKKGWKNMFMYRF